MQDIKTEEMMGVGGNGVYENSLFSVQLFYKFKTDVKNKV